MFGYTREELLTLHLKDTYVQAENTLAHQRLDHIGYDKPSRCSRLLQRKDGTVIPVEISATKMSDDCYFAVVRACS